jgi:hypothetical protein
MAHLLPAAVLSQMVPVVMMANFLGVDQVVVLVRHVLPAMPPPKPGVVAGGIPHELVLWVSAMTMSALMVAPWA